MFQLLAKAKPVFITLFLLHFVALLAGFIAGECDYVHYKTLSKRGIFRLSRTLEYRIPGYGDHLRSYRDYHNRRQFSLISGKNFLGLGVLIFLNNFVAANITMIIRALFVLPIILNVAGKFLQGVIIAQAPGNSMIYIMFVMEFGGYFFTICATLAGVLWALFSRRFGFSTRKEALLGGFKLLGFCYCLSGIGILAGSIVEVFFLKSLLP